MGKYRPEAFDDGIKGSFAGQFRSGALSTEGNGNLGAVFLHNRRSRFLKLDRCASSRNSKGVVTALLTGSMFRGRSA